MSLYALTGRVRASAIAPPVEIGLSLRSGFDEAS
jgi:hypothetical protein